MPDCPPLQGALALRGPGLYHAPCEILVLRPETKPMPPTVEAQSPDYWTTREFLLLSSNEALSSAVSTEAPVYFASPPLPLA